MFKNIAAIAAVAALSSGCYSTTEIYSKPARADVVIDQTKSLGKTPIHLEEQVWLWTSHSLTVQKDGYHSQTIKISSEGMNFAYLAVCICTLGTVIPLMFVSSYPEQYVVELKPAAPESAAAPMSEELAINFRE